MATRVEDTSAVPRGAALRLQADQDFFTRFTVILALLILFGFAQFAMRGFVDFGNVPILTHLHGIFMVGWLGLAVAQNILVQRSELRLHRKLGWLAAALVAGIAVIGVSVGFSAVAAQRVPPFFSESYFLALTLVEPIAFACVVAWGVSLRRKTQWHRRAMLGANVIILEPALGRLLPMPLLGGWGEWVILGLQLIVLAILARHDRRVLGKAHPATLRLFAILPLVHVAVLGISMFPPFVTMAEAIAGR